MICHVFSKMKLFYPGLKPGAVPGSVPLYQIWRKRSDSSTLFLHRQLLLHSIVHPTRDVVLCGLHIVYLCETYITATIVSYS